MPTPAKLALVILSTTASGLVSLLTVACLGLWLACEMEGAALPC